VEVPSAAKSGAGPKKTSSIGTSRSWAPATEVGDTAAETDETADCASIHKDLYDRGKRFGIVFNEARQRCPFDAAV
jgi:hypothetical protein